MIQSNTTPTIDTGTLTITAATADRVHHVRHRHHLQPGLRDRHVRAQPAVVERREHAPVRGAVRHIRGGLLLEDQEEHAVAQDGVQHALGSRGCMGVRCQFGGLLMKGRERRLTSRGS
jgi:hypothetical protein